MFGRDPGAFVGQEPLMAVLARLNRLKGDVMAIRSCPAVAPLLSLIKSN
jgi:hypothetical protein